MILQHQKIWFAHVDDELCNSNFLFLFLIASVGGLFIQPCYMLIYTLWLLSVYETGIHFLCWGAALHLVTLLNTMNQPLGSQTEWVFLHGGIAVFGQVFLFCRSAMNAWKHTNMKLFTVRSLKLLGNNDHGEIIVLGVSGYLEHLLWFIFIAIWTRNSI